MDAEGALDEETMNDKETGERRTLMSTECFFYHLMSKSYIKDKQIVTKCFGLSKDVFILLLDQVLLYDVDLDVIGQFVVLCKQFTRNLFHF